MNQVADQWNDYECIDAGNGEKLERWKDVILRRPDPLALWPIDKEDGEWKNPHAHYHRSNKGGGHWEYKKKFKESWTIGYRQLRFKVSPTGFKHTGLFPEQAANWDFMMNKIKEADREIRVLNLFAYTGGATMACAAAGATVCHVDASKGMVEELNAAHIMDCMECGACSYICPARMHLTHMFKTGKQLVKDKAAADRAAAEAKKKAEEAKEAAAK